VRFGGGDGGGGGLLLSEILSTRGSACSSLCNPEASRTAVSIATAMETPKALEYFSFASESKRLCICIF